MQFLYHMFDIFYRVFFHKNSISLLTWHWKCVQFSTQCGVVWQGPCNQGPEHGSVVHLFQVAQFVHYQVVDQVWWQVYYFIIKIQVAFRRATTPPCFLVFNKYPSIRKLIECVPLYQFRCNKYASRFYLLAPSCRYFFLWSAYPNKVF